MLVHGFTDEFIATDGVRSFALQDVVINATSTELRRLADFLIKASNNLEGSDSDGMSEEFPNSALNPLVGITFTVSRADK